MIKELSDLGKRLREEQYGKKLIHNAIKDEPMAIDLLIRKDGSFDSFLAIPKHLTPAEAITAKKGKARLLLDKAEEVLCYKDQEYIERLKSEPDAEKKTKKYIEGVRFKHELFIEKLNIYQDLEVVKPVIRFYNENKTQGLDQAVQAFSIQIDKKQASENIAFRLCGKSERIHESPEVLNAIINYYEDKQHFDESEKRCSLCGTAEYPIVDIPHGFIKNMPSGPRTGNVLVSYNEKAFESYELKGNDNSSICTNCARTYVEGLNWLLSNGFETKDEKGRPQFTNRKNFGSDTAMVYWTRKNQQLDELDLLENPDAGQVGALIDSVTSGIETSSHVIQDDLFYSCTLSGASARIAVRDWIELSLSEYRKNIGQWFKDITIESFGVTHYTPLYWLARAGQNEKSDSDTTLSRVATHLWNAALKQSKPPLWIVSAVLKRLRYIEPSEDGKTKNDPVTRERAALIRFILNRNRKEGGYVMNEQLDKENLSPAYVCGQIFAVMVDIQRAALGKKINAGIRERFFSFASTSPASAFGRLMKLSQTHLNKLRGEKPGLSFILDQELQFECAKIKEHRYPTILSLEEQGQFALGYYHKKQETWLKAQANKELKDALENEEEEK